MTILVIDYVESSISEPFDKLRTGFAKNLIVMIEQIPHFTAYGGSFGMTFFIIDYVESCHSE